MKLNLFTTATVLAMAGAVISQPAKAQFTSGSNTGTAASGDLILSFDDPTAGDTGSSIDFEVDLGQLSLYSQASKTLSIVNIAADLKADYGSAYFSNSNIKFGILGATAAGTPSNGVKGGSVFVSDPTTTAFPTLTTSTLSQDNTHALPIYSPNSDTTNIPTDGIAANSYDVKAASGDSFHVVETRDGFGSTTAAFAGGSVSPDLYLDVEQPGASAFVKGTSMELSNGGFFDISSSGEVEFVLPGGDQVPEPSSYAMLAAGGAILVCYLRRENHFQHLITTEPLVNRVGDENNFSLNPERLDSAHTHNSKQ